MMSDLVGSWETNYGACPNADWLLMITHADQSSVIVALDTNIWVSSRMLTSPEACEFLSYCRHTNRLILLPEVIEEEVRVQYRSALTECANEIRNHNNTLIALIGRWDELHIPTEKEINEAIEARFQVLSPFLHRTELTTEHSRDALKRTINRMPPASPNGEQYRDCLLWAAVINSSSKTIELVTNDSGFFQRKAEMLHETLVAEAAQKGKEVRVHRHLTGLLAKLGDEGKLTIRIISEIVRAFAHGALNGYADKFGLRVKSIFSDNMKISLFVTEDPNKLLAEYSGSLPLETISQYDEESIFGRGSIYVRVPAEPVLMRVPDSKELLERPFVADEVVVFDRAGHAIPSLSKRWVNTTTHTVGAIRVHRVKRELGS